MSEKFGLFDWLIVAAVIWCLTATVDRLGDIANALNRLADRATGDDEPGDVEGEVDE